MNQRISDDYSRNIPENYSPKMSDKAFKQFLNLMELEGEIQQLNMINDVAKKAQKGERGATLMATQTYTSKKANAKTPAPLTTDLKSILQSSVQNELSYLTQMLNILKADLGSNNPAVIKLEQEIAQLKNSFPNFNSADVALLHAIISQSLNLEGQLKGSSAKIQFLHALAKFLISVRSSNTANVSVLNQELAEVNAQISAVTNISQDLKTLEDLLALMKAGKTLTSAQLTQFLNAINDMNSRYSNLPQTVQNMFKGMMTGLGNFQVGSGGMTMAQFMGDYQMYVWTQQYLSNPNNPNTKTGLMNYLEQQIENYPDNTTLGAEIKARLQSDYTNFPGTGVSGEANWVNYNSNNSTVSVNSGFVANFNSLFTLSPSQATYFTTALDQYGSMFTTFLASLHNVANGYQNSINILNQINSVFNTAISKIGIMLIYTESLQQAFADAILNHYMPGQEAYLRDIAAILFMDNFGTNMNNVLLNDISDFSDAANNYNMNNWVQSRSAGNGVYNGTVSQAQSQLNAEKNQVSTDLSKASKALNDISAQEANLASQVAHGKISPSNAAKIKQELEKDRQSLEQAKVYLKNLQTDLSHITFSASGSGQFTISGGSLTQVAADERLVINGDPSQGGLGGLTTIAGDIESNSQYWGGQSQTSQMQLQMTMTQIQQEWAVVTTALQLLNQMYMAVAQAISK